MPKEVHYLLFSRGELEAALLAFANAAAAEGAKRYGGVRNLRLVDMPDGGVGAKLDFVSHSNEVTPRELLTSDLKSALLLFCRHHSIPIAQRAHCEIEAFGDQLVLMITVDFRNASPTIEGTTVRYHENDAVHAQDRARQL